MLLDWVNIKYINDKGRTVLVRGNKATTSNKVSYFLRLGWPIDKALIEARSDRNRDLVLAPITFKF